MLGRELRVLLAGGMLVACSMPAAAESLQEWLAGDYATGTWGGARTQLEAFGITPSLAYTTDLMAVRNGNAGSGDGFDYAGRFDAALGFDFEKLFGIAGMSLYASAAWPSGSDLSERQVGNIFAVQQVYTGQNIRLAQLYLQQNAFDDQFTFKIGRLTTEDDFLASDIYTNYVNGGINGVPSNIPDGNSGFTTAPFAQWGLVGAVEPIESLRFALGVYNADDDANRDTRHGVDFHFEPSDGVLAIGEVAYSWNQPVEVPEQGAAAEAHQPPQDAEPATGPGLPGMTKFGLLYQSGDRDDLGNEDRQKDGSPGFYVSGEQMVYREGEEGDQGLTPWAVLTYLPRESINEIPVFFGAGLVYKGLIPTRDDDNAAIGFFYGKLSNDLEQTGSEKVLEVAYTAQLTPWFYVRPDLQLVFDPSGVGSAGTAVVGGAEIGIVF